MILQWINSEFGGLDSVFGVSGPLRCKDERDVEPYYCEASSLLSFWNIIKAAGKKIQSAFFSPRQQPVVPLLLLILLAPCIVYIWFIVVVGNEQRIDQGLQRQAEMARMGAHILDDQWRVASLHLRLLAEQDDLQSAFLRNQETRIQENLQKTIHRAGQFVFLAAYRLDGRRLTASSRNAILPRDLAPEDASQTDWFQTLSSGRTLYTGALQPMTKSDPKIQWTLAVPIKSEDRVTGYLLAGYQEDDLTDWMQSLTMSGSRFALIDPAGNKVFGNIDLKQMKPPLKEYLPYHNALAQQQDALEFPAPDSREPSLVGYAFADAPQWVLLLVQPREAVISSTSTLLRLLFIPILFLMGAAAWTIALLYKRQTDLTRQLAQQNVLLKETDEARADFLAHASHDLRAPLTNMRLALASVQDPEADWDPRQVKECCRQVNEEIDQLTARVRNLMEISRLEARVWPMEKIPADMTDIAASALERIRPSFCGREIRWEFPSEPLLVDCDLDQIESVIVNLLENADKYSPPGLPLCLRGHKENDQVQFEVEDFGPGIPAGEELRIFEKFYRAGADRSIPGTGLGLAICQAIVRAHDGVIGVCKGSAGGSIFWFTLPLLLEPEEKV
jgi:signal transduction histidine kinase